MDNTWTAKVIDVLEDGQLAGAKLVFTSSNGEVVEESLPAFGAVEDLDAFTTYVETRISALEKGDNV